jgi:hypothetical protein
MNLMGILKGTRPNQMELSLKVHIDLVTPRRQHKQLQILLLIVLCIIIQLGWKAKKDLFIAKGSSTP